MKRRTLLRLLPFPAVRGWSQATAFPGQHRAALNEIAALVLPSELGRQGAEKVVEEFIRWVQEYKPGADMEHGYGNTRVRSKPASPAGSYSSQLATLAEALNTQDAAAKRSAIEASLEKANIRDLPRSPDGKSIVADLMSFYYRSSDANDLCHQAAIKRETCRGLEGSGNPPPPLKGKA